MKKVCISLLGMGLALLSASANADTIVSAASGKPYYFNQWDCFVPYSEAQVSSYGGACHTGSSGNQFYWETYIHNSNASTVSKTLYAYGRQGNQGGCVLGGCVSSCTGYVLNANGDVLSFAGSANLPTTPGWVQLGSAVSVPALTDVVFECYLSDYAASGLFGYVSSLRMSGTP